MGGPNKRWTEFFGVSKTQTQQSKWKIVEGIAMRGGKDP